METRTWQQPKSLRMATESQDFYQDALDRLINAWSIYWSAWLDQGETSTAERALMRSLHDPEASLDQEDRSAWASLERECHELLHKLRATQTSKNRQDLCNRTLIREVTQFQNDCWNESIQRQRAQSEADALTGLPNRRRLAKDLLREESRVLRGAAACIAIIDLDHFKTFNDQHGHLAGDQALRAVADFLRGALRPYDGVYRYGGEEFILILPGMEESCALQNANRLCERLAATRLYFDDGVPFQLSISIGIAALGPNAALESVLAAADAALYQAKADGRGKAMLGSAGTFANHQHAVSS
ncbi:GGDEF domain-containing protein [Acidithiobacillus sp. IBUN Pt1247-S3]|uniref:GGDEF domain-containing protein n=1 Tax=Acidithiobacillus sp. IBUN Pt1247-S3 TaxID=3166642 RepID=UPI0034E41EEC